MSIFLSVRTALARVLCLACLNCLLHPIFGFSRDLIPPRWSSRVSTTLVSISSHDRSYFSIGAIEQISKPEPDAYKFYAVLMTFIEKEGLPSLSQLTYTAANIELHIRFEKKTAKSASLLSKTTSGTLPTPWFLRCFGWV
jgi:hypothetical protein